MSHVQTPREGIEVGGFRLLRELGENLHLARDLQLAREVVLEFLPPGDSTALERARAMAAVAHEHVVAIRRLGTLTVPHEELERKYIALEYVSGGSLRTWLERAPPREDVVQAFVQAGRGLAALHERGLVHGHFGPDYVLLTPGGSVKVTSNYRIPAPVGTPASDQLAFCECLWEALCGTPPPQVGEGDLGRWGPALRRGLEPDPMARYPSMKALLAALAPNEDRTRRRRTVGVLAVAGAAGLSAWLIDRTPSPCPPDLGPMHRSWGDEQKAELSDAFARAPFAAERALTTVEDTLGSYADRWNAAWVDGCEATRVRHEQSDQTWELRMACLEHARSRFDAIVGVLSEGGEAVNNASTVVRGLRDIGGCDDPPDHPGPPHTDEEREAVAQVDAMLDRAAALQLAGRMTEADEVARDALARSRTLEDPGAIVRALYRHGSLLESLADYPASAEVLEEAWTGAIALGDASLVVEIGVQYAPVLGYQLSRTDEAKRVLQDMRAWSKRGATRSSDADIVWIEGVIALVEGDLEVALERMQRSLELTIEAFGENHLEVATSYINLGVVGGTAQGYAPQREAFEKADAILRDNLGDEHPAVLQNRVRLVLAMVEDTGPGPARDELLRLLPLMEVAYGSSHPSVVDLIMNLAVAEVMLEDYDAAMTHTERGLELAQHFEDQRPSKLLELKAVALGHLGRSDEAQSVYEDLVAKVEAREGSESVHLVSLLGNLANAKSTNDDLDGAVSSLERAIQIARHQAPESPVVRLLLGNIANLHLDQDRPDEALTAAEELVSLIDEDPPTAQASRAHFLLARALWRAGGDHDRARSQADQARAIAMAVEGEARDDEFIAQVDAWLAKPGT